MDPKAYEGAAQAQPPAMGVPVSGAYYQQALPPVTEWSTGLFDCFDDISSCVVASLFPCITIGQIAEFLDQGAPSCFCHGTMYTLIAVITELHCLYSCFYRAKMREQFGLQESPCADLLVHFFCEPCSLCQMHRELTNRGIDLNQGWQAHVERQQLTAASVPPPMHAGMTR